MILITHSLVLTEPITGSLIMELVKETVSELGESFYEETFPMPGGYRVKKIGLQSKLYGGDLVIGVGATPKMYIAEGVNYTQVTIQSCDFPEISIKQPASEAERVENARAFAERLSQKLTPYVKSHETLC